MQAYSATQLVLLPSMSQVSFTTFSLYISIILQIIHLYVHSLKRKKICFETLAVSTYVLNKTRNSRTIFHCKWHDWMYPSDNAEKLCQGSRKFRMDKGCHFFFIKLCTKYNFVPVNFFGCLEGTYEQKKNLFFHLLISTVFSDKYV